MIANDEQLELVMEQIRGLESGLASLVRNVWPKSQTQFRVFAEGWVDQMAILRFDVYEYLGISTSSEIEEELAKRAGSKVSEHSGASPSNNGD